MKIRQSRKFYLEYSLILTVKVYLNLRANRSVKSTNSKYNKFIARNDMALGKKVQLGIKYK